jgi:hypothetical protein
VPPSDEDDGYSDQYGAWDVAALFAGIERPSGYIPAIWQHGCVPPWSASHTHIFFFSKCHGRFPIFTARKDECERLIDEGITNCRAIGMPILYTQPTEAARMPRSLLLMPQHTQHNSMVDYGKYHEYIESILQYRQEVDRITVSLHARCYANEKIRSIFEDKGIHVELGADPYDRNALSRMRYLFESHECMTTNSYGSHIPYAMHFGCRVSYYGSHTMTYHFNFQENHKRYDRSSVLEKNLVGNESEAAFLHQFSALPHQGRIDKAVSDYFLGTDNQLTPAEMLDLLQKVTKGRPWRK